MSDQPAPPGIPEDDWAATPLTVRVLVTSLLDRVARLEEHVRQTSRTSSKPPSSDPPSAPPRPARRPSGRKTGGQPGHEGHGRALLPAEQVDQIVDVQPEACAQCGALLRGEDAQPARHQVTELPRVVPAVTEYRRHTLTCAACGARTQAPWPEEMPQGCFGPRAQATVAYLTGRQGISQRDAQEALRTLFHLEVSLGSIAALEQQVSAAVAAPVDVAHTYVQTQHLVNVDETGWREGTTRLWLWVGVTTLVSVFLLRATRGSQGAKDLLGATFRGIVGSDRWSAYTWVDVTRRQLCWAHLLRDFTAFTERGGGSTRIGQALLDTTDEMFALWYRVRVGTLSRAEFQRAMVPLQTQVGALLREGVALEYAKTRHTCEHILKLEGALWTFVAVAGVEPTNNAAERALRRAVLWRRRSFGTQSAAGSCFVERLLTVVTTLRQQERDVLDYLTEACAALIRGLPPPSLLPNTLALTGSAPAPFPVAA
ncbi:MAG: IS66 family transposase [Acidimicrobiales bacterium]